MGYRSDVYIAVAFTCEEDLKEVLAVYAIDPLVQKHDLLKAWEQREDNILYFHEDSVKWYDSSEAVQGIMHMLSLVDTFYEERDEMQVAHRFVRIGEEMDDIEERYEIGNDQGILIDKLWEGISIIRNVEVTL
jgi:hypothetical protein|tara:strand:- start:276 stop:674 length:399 start_codon:yes stop_codon:yes gene_type:complete